MAEQLGIHPNWAALATTTFTFKKFVKAADTTISSIENNTSVAPRENQLSGEETKEFYEEVLSNQDLARKKLNPNNSLKLETIELSDDDDVEIIDNNSNQKLLVAIQNEDISSVKNLSDCDYNCQDEYGWTTLDIAAMVGNIEIVRYLRSKGATLSQWEKIRRSLVKKNMYDVINCIEKEDDEEVEIIDVTEDPDLETCPDCGDKYDKNYPSSHRAKISHQLSRKNDENIKRNPGFQISELNVGFKLMRKSGWDGTSGLGEGGGGKLFPVKTIFKQDRKGLEAGDRNKSRVTHFGANDVKSIENRRRRKPFNVKKQKKIVKRGNKLLKVVISKDQLLREEMGSL